jgi:hypothetical protein
MGLSLGVLLFSSLLDVMSFEKVTKLGIMGNPLLDSEQRVRIMSGFIETHVRSRDGQNKGLEQRLTLLLQPQSPSMQKC